MIIGKKELLNKVHELAEIQKMKDSSMKYNDTGLPLTCKPGQPVTKAIIPVAGLGTRLFPATKVMKKDLLPVLDSDGLLKPLLVILLEQLLKAGIGEICLVVGEGEDKIYKSLFRKLEKETYEKLSLEKKSYEDFLQLMGNRITYAVQKEKKGFGHAVYLAGEFCKEEPALLLLGDMIYHSNLKDMNCMQQMISVYEATEKTVVSLHTVDKEDVSNYGILHGIWEDSDERLMRVDRICEKPSLEFSEKYMKVANSKCSENYYAVFGQYILQKDTFDALKEIIRENKTENGEIQLTTALQEVGRQKSIVGYVVNGDSYDVGLPEKYIETVYQYYRAEKTLGQ